MIEDVVQLTLKSLSPGALKFLPITVAVTVLSSFEVPAFGILKLVKVGTP